MSEVMTDATSATRAFRAARDQLLELRGQHERAVSEFAFPDVGPRFNWAVDWFDAFARGNDRPALTIIDDGGSPDETVTTVSFDLMSRRSDQVAAWLAGLGVRRGDAVLLMLGNQVELWHTMLGVMKLGAVLMPTSSPTRARSTSSTMCRATTSGSRCRRGPTPPGSACAWATTHGRSGSTCTMRTT